jgi:hypothetical protein
MSDPGRPPVSPDHNSSTVVHIVETWQPGPHGARDVHVYTSAQAVRLALNGKVVATQGVPERGWALFTSVAYADGVLEAQALAADNTTVIATHSRSSWGVAAALVLSLDAPSTSTGTGSALYLDGSDVALVRASVVDARGNVVMGNDQNVTVAFKISSGPGLVVGCCNGNPASHEANQAAAHSTYHGLVRAVVRVTLDAASPDAVRAMRATVDVDAGKGPRSSSVLPVGVTPPTRITVTASAPGLPDATIDIPLSTDPRDAPLAVAAASVRVASLQ